jgi:hypothetical protein
MVDLDIPPVSEAPGKLIETGPVSRLEVVQRLVAEDDPKPQGVSRQIPLQHPNLVLGTPFLEQSRQIEPRWASTDDEDVERT